MSLIKLSEKDKGFSEMPGAAIVVRCFYCDMTLWAIQANLDKNDKIVCNSEDCKQSAEKN